MNKGCNKEKNIKESTTLKQEIVELTKEISNLDLKILLKEIKKSEF